MNEPGVDDTTTMKTSTCGSFAWITAPGISALAVAIVTGESLPTLAFSNANTRSSKPRLTWLRDRHGRKIDQILLTGIDNGILLTCHGGNAARYAITQALADYGLTQVAPEPGALLGGVSGGAVVLLKLLPRAVGPAGVALVLKALVEDETEAGPALSVEESAAVSRAVGYIFEPPRVQLWGPVNSGKSSLLNALCGEHLAATGDEPGLTRDRVEGRFVHKGHVIRVFDAPGTMSGGSELDNAAIELARSWLDSADLVVELHPAGRPDSSKPEAGEGGPPRLGVASRADEAEGVDWPAVSVRDEDSVVRLREELCEVFFGALLEYEEAAVSALRTFAAQ